MHRTIGLLTAGLVTLLLVGCMRPAFYPGGQMASKDLFRYPSDVWLPQTVNLKDTRTGEVLWTMEVPVGQTLVIQFFRGENKDDPWRPDLMRWKVEHHKKFVTQPRFANQIPVPPAGSRLLVPEYRHAPEYPAQAGG